MDGYLYQRNSPILWCVKNWQFLQQTGICIYVKNLNDDKKIALWIYSLLPSRRYLWKILYLSFRWFFFNRALKRIKTMSLSSPDHFVTEQNVESDFTSLKFYRTLSNQSNAIFSQKGANKQKLSRPMLSLHLKVPFNLFTTRWL